MGSKNFGHVKGSIDFLKVKTLMLFGFGIICEGSNIIVHFLYLLRNILNATLSLNKVALCLDIVGHIGCALHLETGRGILSIDNLF